MNESIGVRLKHRRNELGITLAQISGQTSISSGNLSCIENGKYLPSAVALIELSKVLQCSIDWILTGESSKSEFSSFSDNETTLTSAEQEFIKGFRQLDSTIIFKTKSSKKGQPKNGNIIQFPKIT